MAKTKAQRAKGAADSVQKNEYVRRLIEDDELRDSIRTAYDSARTAYDRVQSKKKPAQALMDDKKVHRDLREASENLREASDRLRGRNTGGGFGFGKLLVIAVAGAALALVLSEDLRKTVLDKLFGAEEEFEYTSTTVSGGVNGN